MKIYFFLILLFGITHSKNHFRDFIKNFLDQNKDISYELSKDCFGETFESDLEILKSLYEGNNYNLIYASLIKIGYGVLQNCPIEEIKTIFNNFKNNMKIFYIKNKTKEIAVKELVKTYKKGKYSGEIIGRTLGKVVYILIHFEETMNLPGINN